MKGNDWIWRVVGMFLALSTTQAWAEGNHNIWVLVDTTLQKLFVMREDKTVDRFENIAFGRGGVTREKRRGDNKTPLGVFHIGWVNKKSKYHLFFGLDYPNLPYVKWGWNRGMLDGPTLRALIRANFEEAVPPQDTPLGGFIGIHGLGKADHQVHRLYNWTKGCIALTDSQIDRLSHWVGVGTTVMIR